VSDPDDPMAREVESLRLRVAALERSLGLLLRELSSNGSISARRGRPEGRVSHEEMAEALESKEHATTRTSTSSPYRDATASTSRSCTSCGKPLDDDDPELVSESGRGVCPMCFHRGA
jgi:hypothetical protein